MSTDKGIHIYVHAYAQAYCCIIPFAPHKKKSKCNEECHNLYPSPNAITMITSRRMRGLEGAACMREILSDNLKGRPRGVD